MKQVNSIPVLFLLSSCFIVFVTPLSIPALNDNVAVETKHVLEKDNLLLVCNTTKRSDLEGFYWIRNNTIYSTSNFYKFGWKLEFIDILREAKGIYSCHATNNKTGENVTLVAFKVDVQYPAEITNFGLYPLNITVNETFNVDCGFHANPEPTWSIMKENTGRRIMSATLSADVSLVGNHVWCGDSGMWVCTGWNTLSNGVNATRGQYLTVRCSPQPNPDVMHVYEYKASLGSTVAMTLDVVADPDPMYKWTRGQENKKFGDVVVEESSRKATLKIFNIGPGDFGDYTLEMRNSMGTYYANFKLNAYGYPGKPFDIRGSSITYNSVNLTWISGFDSGTPQQFQIIKWSSNDYEPISPVINGPYEDGGFGKKWNYHLTGLEGDTLYKISVTAQNYGNMSISEPIFFYTSSPPLANHSSNYNVMIAVGIGLAVMSTCLLVLVLALRSRQKRRAQFQLEDKKFAAKNMMAQYGGTFSTNGGLKN